MCTYVHIPIIMFNVHMSCVEGSLCHLLNLSFPVYLKYTTFTWGGSWAYVGHDLQFEYIVYPLRTVYVYAR